MSDSTAPLSQLYTGAQCATLDQQAIAHWGFTADQLMARAGEFAWRQLQRRWPAAQSLCVCAGVGNNAGDGYVVARLAHEQGLTVQVLQLQGRRLQGAAGRAQAAAEQVGVAVLPVADSDIDSAPVRAALAQSGVVVDALLGIGLQAPPRPLCAALIAAINAADPPVLALDVPSGLNSETAAPEGAVVQADLTVTFIGDKLALHTGQGRVLAGTVVVSHLGLPRRELARLPGCVHHDLPAVRLPPLAAGAYKHKRGHVVLVGGDHGMSGALLLSAQAALQSGAGLVSVITRGSASAGLLARCPELMVCDARRWPAVAALLQRATVIVCGPGLGQSAWGRSLLAAVQAAPTAVQRVFDADALNLLAMQPRATPLAGAVLTPHSGEAARLLGQTSAAVEADRLGAARALAERWQAIAVLKGPGSLVADGSSVSVCRHGNPGMASAGMGDVLAGVIGGLLGQQAGQARAAGAVTDTAREAIAASVRDAVTVHSAAADAAAAVLGARSLHASAVIEQLPATLERCA